MQKYRTEVKEGFRGRTYYMLLLTFLSIVSITIMASVIVTVSAYRSARDTSEEAMDMAMRSYDLYLQNIKTSMSVEEMTEYLNQDGVVEAWAELTELPDGKERAALMNHLSYLHDVNDDTDREYYLYFVRSDQWIGGWKAMTEGRSEAQWLMQQLDLANLEEQEEEEIKQHRTVFFMEDRNGAVNMVEYHMIFPYVFLVNYGSAPTLPLPEALSDLFSGAEMYFIDVYDYAYPFQESHTLQGKFTYDDVYTGSQDNHLFSIEIDGKPYRCYTHATYPGNLSFVFLSLDVVKVEQEKALMWALSLGVILLLLAILFCFWITNRIYRPVERLMQMLEMKKTGRNRDEFQMLGAEFSNMKDQISAQDDLLRRVRLLRLLRGQDEILGDGAFIAELPSMNLPYFAVAALRIDGFGEKFGELGERKPASLEEQLNTYMKDCGIAVMTTQDSGFLLAIFGLEEPEIIGLTGAIGAFKNLMESKEKLLISVFVSTIHDASQQLYVAYNEALEVASYEDLIEEFNVVATYESVGRYLGQDHRGTAARRAVQFSTAITTLNHERALRLYDEIVEEIMASESLVLIRMRLKSLRDQIMLAVYDAEKTHRSEVGDSSMASRLEMVDTSSTASMRDVLVGILQELQNADNPGGADKGVFCQVLSFVQDHYRDPSFSASTVAAHFGTSQSNVTRMFNRFNNSGFLEYVHGLRIAKARELLESTDYSVADISTMVGYTNSLTMTRAFKRYTGTTPGSFRKK